MVVGDTAEYQAQNQDQGEGDGQDYLTIRPGLGHEIFLGFFILAESAQSDWTVVGSKHPVTDGPLVLFPDMIREFVVQASELAEWRLGWHLGAKGAVARFGEGLLPVMEVTESGV